MAPKKASAKKTTAKKAPAKKTVPKKIAAKKAPTKKTIAKKALAKKASPTGKGRAGGGALSGCVFVRVGNMQQSKSVSALVELHGGEFEVQHTNGCAARTTHLLDGGGMVTSTRGWGASHEVATRRGIPVVVVPTPAPDATLEDLRGWMDTAAVAAAACHKDGTTSEQVAATYRDAFARNVNQEIMQKYYEGRCGRGRWGCGVLRSGKEPGSLTWKCS